MGKAVVVSSGNVTQALAKSTWSVSPALAAAGVEVQADWKLDGVNLLPYLDGKNTAAPHDTLYWRFGEQMALRQGDWKLVRYDPVADGGKGNATPTKLYNLAKDIGEAQRHHGAKAGAHQRPGRVLP